MENNDRIIEKLSDVVSNMVQVSGTRAQDFLTLTNSGGIVGCLGLIGSSSPHASDMALRIILVMYLLGLALAGWTMIRGFRLANRIAWSFAEAVRAYRAGEVEMNVVGEVFSAGRMKKFATVGVQIGAASLALFTLATIGACGWLLCI